MYMYYTTHSYTKDSVYTYIHTCISFLCVCPSVLGVYANFTCPTNSRCEGGRCRCNRGWMGEDCDMRELTCTYTDAALLGAVQECTHHSHLSVVPFCNAVASNPCGYYNLTCHNNGSCISMYTANGTYTYSCLCRPSFTGHDCSRQLSSESMTDRHRTDDYFDECLKVSLRMVNDFAFTPGTQCGSVECLNGGQCMNSGCECSPPYSGHDCSTFNVCEFEWLTLTHLYIFTRERATHTYTHIRTHIRAHTHTHTQAHKLTEKSNKGACISHVHLYVYMYLLSILCLVHSLLFYIRTSIYTFICSVYTVCLL